MQPLTNMLSAFIFFSVPVGGSDLPLIVVWLIIAAFFFTFYLSFINLRGFAFAVSVVRGALRNDKHDGEISHFQALTAAMSGTIGVGNMAGVAITVSLGGPGAIFWLIVAGLVGMTTKFVECTLGVKYRIINADGTVSGGPMYYLRDGLAQKGMARLGKYLGGFFAVSIVIGCLGVGNMFQSNQAYVQLVEVTGGATSPLVGYGWLVGLALALLVGLIIVGGIRSIANVTVRLVPFMVITYVAMALMVLLLNFTAIPSAIALIFSSAFTMQGVSGGFIGIMILGFQRAAFSNEAGLGSASIAHAAVQTDEPLSEGFVGLLEPFVDTVIVCTLTGLVLVITMPTEALMGSGLSGIELTSAAFEENMSWAPVPLSFVAMIFAFSTMLAWAYYGIKGWTYLFGESKTKEKTFGVIFCIFIVIGASIKLDTVLEFADAMIFIMAIPNLIGLYILAPDVKKDLAAYMQKLQTQRA
ncbi:MAG: alanine:cation symporter family protein [PS1 clade bacterium]|uniref:Alanine:cation symporter family protein n=1 Tax=PS1 clade bacterium TaxID=2175152 RepID=A0A937HDQ0_9PROT|nr:alanine:cation symporter family protein [PS1 clade bacterium]